jgi:hypothetical protein
MGRLSQAALDQSLPVKLDETMFCGLSRQIPQRISHVFLPGKNKAVLQPAMRCPGRH